MMFSDCDNPPSVSVAPQEEQTWPCIDLLTQTYPPNLADELNRLFIREPAVVGGLGQAVGPRALVAQRDRLCSDGSDGSVTSSDQSLNVEKASPQQNLDELSEIVRVVGLRDAIAHLKQLARTSLNPLPVHLEDPPRGLPFRRHSTSSGPSSIPPGFTPRDSERSLRHDYPTYPVEGVTNRLSRWQALQLSAPMANPTTMGFVSEVPEASTWPPSPATDKWQTLRPTASGAGEMMTKESLIELLREQNRRTVRHEFICVFCRNNGESKVVYTSHRLKDANGCIMCPVLRAYTCPICRASGDNAHTLKYCPQAKEAGKAPLKTVRKSNTKLAMLKGTL